MSETIFFPQRHFLEVIKKVKTFEKDDLRQKNKKN